MKAKTLLAVLLGLGLFPALTLSLPRTQARGGDTLYVAPGGDCGGQTPCFDSVQAAVDAADSPDDVVKVAAGTYTGVNYYGGPAQVVYISKSVTIQGGYATTDWETPDADANPTTLDAQRQGRVLYITGNPPAGRWTELVEVSGRASSLTIEGLRITGGDAAGLGGGVRGLDAGGGVYVTAATATIRDNQVFSNTADLGGGLYLDQSDLTLTDNTVTANTAYEEGGGLYLGESNATLGGNSVSNNTAAYHGGGLYLYVSAAALNANTVSYNTAYWVGGGGMYLDGSDATLSGNTLAHNTAGEDGGGLYLDGSNATLSDNTISSNTADDGGGLYVDESDATFNSNVFLSNTARAGGGLYLRRSAPTLNGNTVSSNSADNGGGLYLDQCEATLINNLVADNQAHGKGSGLYIEASSPRLRHTTVARNRGGDGSGIYVTKAWWDSYYSTVALTNTILVSHTVGLAVTAGNTATLEATLWGDGAWANGTDWGGEGTIITGAVNVWGDPAFADPDAGDYHIGPGSAAIDTGVDVGVTTDMDGHPRPIGDGFDIGADEYAAVLYFPLVLMAEEGGGAR
jgi:parallel beta-helix repeat protein